MIWSWSLGLTRCLPTSSQSGLSSEAKFHVFILTAFTKKHLFIILQHYMNDVHIITSFFTACAKQCASILHLSLLWAFSQLFFHLPIPLSFLTHSPITTNFYAYLFITSLSIKWDSFKVQQHWYMATIQTSLGCICIKPKTIFGVNTNMIGDTSSCGIHGRNQSANIKWMTGLYILYSMFNRKKKYCCY